MVIHKFIQLYTIIKSNSLYSSLARVTIGFFIITALWSIMITIFHSKQISDSLESLIIKEVNYYSKISGDIDLTIHNERYNNLLKIITIDSQKNDIVLLNLYDKNQKLLLNIINIPRSKIIPLILKANTTIFAEQNYKIIPISENLVYLSFYKKLSLNNKVYHLKIVKKLDSNTINLIQKDIFNSIIIVFSTVTFIFISIFPIIFSQYNNLLDKTNELFKSNIDTLISLGNAIAKRDSDTSEHNYRVTYYSIKLAEALELSKDEIKTIIKGAFLHDIGKIAISDSILLKQGKLSEKEFDIMKTHVNHGVDIVKNIDWLHDAQKVIQNHHEKVNGSGYPNGLKKDDIPIEAKIFAVVDVFDALTSYRPYKEAFDIEKSIDIIKGDINTHFDSDIVAKFEAIYKDLYYDIVDISSKELEDIFFINIKPYFDIKYSTKKGLFTNLGSYK